MAVVEGNKIGRRKKFKEIFNLPEDKVLKILNHFSKKIKMADAVIVCNYW